jgi:hypothetical protein
MSSAVRASNADRNLQTLEQDQVVDAVERRRHL